MSCGTCEPHNFCTIDGQCQLNAGISLCAGDLRALPPQIEIEQVGGVLPEAAGGTIADGTYDLVATREYKKDNFADVYLRAALKFSAGATRAEEIYDPDHAYAADYASPHRLMTVVNEGTTLTFSVSCPNPVIFPTYSRGYTAQGTELWLFQKGLIEVYARRL